MRSPAAEQRNASRWACGAVAGGLALIVLGTLAAASFAAAEPKVENPHGKFKADCALCHGSNGWKPAKISSSFNHASYGFPLTGAHSSAKCMACHASLDFSQGKQLCAACHQDPHRGEMGTDCARCHSARSFVDRTAMVRQHQATRFPLTGSHAQIDCENCHKPTAQGQMQFVGTHAECQNCHMDAYNSAKSPDHVAGGFPLDCSSCHSTLTWSTKTFDHDRTAFPLTGAHRAVACQRCHGDGVYKGKTTDCYSCHQSDYTGATPNHASSGFGTNCITCHTTVTWAGAVFDHSKTAFPLTGAHAAVACNQCHGDGVYQGKSTLCYSCHTTDYNGTTDPKHTSAAATFVTTCETCHNTTVWTTSTFNHSTATTFPLTGLHVGLDCNACHGDNVYRGKSTLCYACHQADYTGTTAPAHATAGFPTTCETCHSTANWTSSTFNHNTSTTFPLTGAHQAVACNGCHGDNVYKGKSTLCYSCHATDYNGTTDPKHSSAATTFVTTCESCHNTTNWTSATFNHTTQTTFPLTGAHITLDCNACHGDNVYKGKSTLCYACHQADYNTTVVNHASAGFNTTCETCHTTTAWSGGKYTAHDTQFPIYSGRHLGKWSSCVDCHASTTNYAVWTCVNSSCHTNTATDSTHRNKANAINLCYSCHPKGTT